MDADSAARLRCCLCSSNISHVACLSDGPSTTVFVHGCRNWSWLGCAHSLMGASEVVVTATGSSATSCSGASVDWLMVGGVAMLTATI